MKFSFFFDDVSLRKRLHSVCVVVSGLLFTSAGFGTPTFTNVSQGANIIHVNSNIFAEALGGGVAWIDIDNDVYQDLYVPSGLAGSASLLYHNNGDGTFTEIAGLTGSDARNMAYSSTGVAVGDYDNDGCDDLFITSGGIDSVSPFSSDQRNTLLRNNFCDTDTGVNPLAGTLTFTDVTVQANLDAEIANSIVAAFGDVDKDGDLDLYVGNNVPNGDLSIRNCQANHFYRNNGDGTFTEESALRGVDNLGCTLGVVLSDYDGDNDLDIYVTNDFSSFSPDNLDQIYRNDSTQTGVPAFTLATNTQLTNASNGMGIAPGDYDNDGDLDYYTTSISDTDPNADPKNVLNRNSGSATFQEATQQAGVNDLSTGLDGQFELFGWGTVFFDADNDGDLDLYKVNGAVNAAFHGAWDTQPNRFYLNNGDTTFFETGGSAQVDGLLADPSPCFFSGPPCYDHSRGVASADYDNDGDVDLYVENVMWTVGATNYPGAPRLYRNESQGNGSDWLKVNLKGSVSNKRGIGAKVRVTSTSAAGTITQMREVRSGSSHGSTNGFPVHFGFPAGSSIDQLTVEWPLGLIQTVASVLAPLNQAVTVLEDTIYVDDDNNSGVENGSQADPYNTIQEAMDVAQSGNVIQVEPGQYAGVSGVPGVTNVTLSGSGALVTFISGDLADLQRATVVEGFTIDNGQITISRFGIIRNNFIQNSPFAAITITGVNTTIQNNVITDNPIGIFVTTSATGASVINNTIVNSSILGISFQSTAIEVRNCIFGNNGTSLSTNFSPSQVFFSIIDDAGFAGVNGNLLITDPLFVDPANNDYHLQSGSLGIDSGTPTDDYSREPQNNGDRINMGAYGDTAEAAVGLDTDGDGLTNQNEQCFDGDCGSYNPYDPNTNPTGGDLDYTKSDTDGDFFDDKTEVDLGFNPIDPVSAPPRGDINADGVVNAPDALLAQRHVLNITSLTPEQIGRGDVYPPVGGDAAITISDLLLINQLALSIP